MSLTLATNLTPAQATIVVDGEVDVCNAQELREAINSVLTSDASRIVLDTAHMSYMDSAGLGVLVGATARASRAGKELMLANVQSNVARIIRLLGLDAQINIESEGGSTCSA